MTYVTKIWNDFIGGGTPVTGASLTDFDTRVANGFGDITTGLLPTGTAVSAATENTGSMGATIQAELDAFPTSGHAKGGALLIPRGTYNIERPVIVPDNVKLIGLGGRGASAFFATSAFPSMTLSNGGPLALPAATITTASMSANMPTTGGVITVLSSDGIQKILYTAISGNNFTGCSGGTGSVTNGATIGTFMIWLGHPITATNGAYGARVESLYIDLSPTGASAGARPGSSGVFTNRAQEESGLRDVLLRNYMHRGICVNAIVPSGQVTQNIMFRGLTLQASSTSDVNLVSCEFNGSGATCRGMDDVTFVSTGLIAIPGTALSLIGASGTFSRFNVEQHATGIVIDNAASANRGLVLDGVIGYGAALDDLIIITASTTNSSVAIIGIEKLSAPTANLITDLSTGNTFTDNSIGMYVVGQPDAALNRGVICDSPSMTSRFVSGVATKIKAGTISDSDFTIAPPSGTLAVDTTNSQLYVKVGATWKKVAVA